MIAAVLLFVHRAIAISALAGLRRIRYSKKRPYPIQDRISLDLRCFF